MTPVEAINAYVGAPWQADGLHCWELVRRVQERVFGRTVPFVAVAPGDRRELLTAFETHPARSHWAAFENPAHGAIVLMSRGDARRDCHAGTYLDVDGGGILHADEHAGVMFERPEYLAARGWRRLTYHLPV